MRIGVLGINFKSADIGIREFVSRACQKRISRISPIASTNACVVLSTCNRTEIYFSSDNLAEAHSALLNVLREEVPVPFEHTLYSYFGADCFLHLARVTAGLDSAIVAESEIQRQVKISYEQTLLHYPLPGSMHFLFQKALKIGKQIRTHHCIAQNQVTIPRILFEISQRMLKKMDKTPVLWIGNSEINRRVIIHFRRKGVERMTLCTRSLHSAKDMANSQGIGLLPWEQLSDWQQFPLVICGTNTSRYIVEKPEGIVHTRLIFDLGIPRNVDPSLNRHPMISLLNIEELGSFIEARQQKNAHEITRAEAIILEGVQRYTIAYGQKEKKVFACA